MFMKRFLAWLSCMVLLATTASSGIVLAESGDFLYDLTVNQHADPNGVELPVTFGWKLQSDRVGAAQTAYLLEVAEDAQFQNIIWSKEDESGDANAIPFDGTLSSGTDYWWRVTATTDEGKTITASSYFLTGLLEETDVSFTKSGAAENAEGLSYTIETDVYGGIGAASLVFNAIDEQNNYMWQLNFSDGATVVLKPHTCINNKYTALSDYTKDVTEAVGGIEGLRKGVRLKVKVTDQAVTTYLNGNKVSEIPASALAGLAPALGLVGYRGAGNEFSYYDNLTVRRGDELLLSYDFEEYLPFEKGELQDGKFLLNYTSGVVLPTHSEVYRTVFTTEKEVADAKLFTAALGVYDAWINGCRVGEQELKAGYADPDERQYYNTFNVTNLIGEQNALSAVVTSGWWNGQVVDQAESYLNNKDNGFWALLRITYTDGTVETVSTDAENWKIFCYGPVLMGDIYEGEVYDARISDSWKQPDYDDTGWLNAVVSTDFTGELSTSLGADVYQRNDLTRSVKSGYIYDSVDYSNAAQYGVVQKIAELNGDSFVLKPRQTAILDLGQNFAGREEITVSGNAGTMIKVRHAEMLNEGEGSYDRGNDGPEGSVYQVALRGVEATSRYILAGSGKEVWHATHSFYGFRYLEITATETVTVHSVTGQVLTSATDDTGTLITGDEDVNQLLSNIRWGMYSNYFSVPTDCPQRDERNGWTADTQVFAVAGSYLNNSKEFLRSFLQAMRDTQREDGAYTSVAPTGNFGQTYGALGWADAGVIVTYELWKQYGDTDVIAEMYDSMQLYVDGYLAGTDKQGGAHNYGDHLAYEANDNEIKNMLGVAYYAYDALLMNEMAEALGKAEDAARYLALYQTEKEYFIEQYVNADGTLIRSEQSPCLYALYLDLLPDEGSRTAVAKQLTDNISSNGNRLQTGFLGTKIILETLTEIGETELAYKLLLQHNNPSWLYTVDQGATTMWERWNSYSAEDGFGNKSMNSFNHYAYGAVAGWMYRYMAGIVPGTDGYKSFTLQPYPDRSLGSAEAEYDSVYGLIKSAWSYEGETFRYNCTVPANTTATIRIPVEDETTLTGGDADGLTFVKTENGYAVFTAVAGSYSFETYASQSDTVSITVANTDESVLSYLLCNGDKYGWSSPIEVSAGTELQLTAVAYNDVDYQLEWYDASGEKLGVGTITVTPQENASYTVKPVSVAKSNLAEGATVTASSTVSSSWAAANLTDGVLIHTSSSACGWSSTSQGKNITTLPTPVTLTVDLGAITTFDQWKLYPRTYEFSASSKIVCFPVDYTVEISNDNSSWTTVSTVTDGTVPQNIYQPALTELSVPVTGRYLRFSFAKINSYDDYNNSHIQLSELAICNSAGEVQKNLALGAGLTVSSNNGGTWDKQYLNDGVVPGTTTACGWSSAKLGVGTDATSAVVLPTAVTATLDLGAETAFNQWKLYPRNHDLTAVRMFPISYTVEVSNDNSSWTTVATVSDGEVPATPSQPAVTELAEKAVGRYVKFTFTKINLPDTWKNNLHVQLTELELFYDETIDTLQEYRETFEKLNPDHFEGGEQIALWLAKEADRQTLIDDAETLVQTLQLKENGALAAKYLVYSRYWKTGSNWLVTDAADLQELEQFSKTSSLAGFTFTQTADISMAGIIGYTGIGAAGTDFKGTYDGNFHAVTDLQVFYDDVYTNNTGFGLFATINGAVVKNVRLLDSTVSVTIPADAAIGSGDLGVGGIVGRAVNGATIENCYNGADVTFNVSDGSTKDISVAGIVGRGMSSTKILNCVNAGTVTSAFHAAGINDWGQNGTNMSYIINCVNLGQINGSNRYAIARYNDLSSHYLIRYQRYNNNYMLEGTADSATNRDADLTTTEIFKDIFTLVDGSIFYAAGWKLDNEKLMPGQFALGDLNASGTTDLADVVRLLQALVGYDVKLYASADLSGDGRVSIFDAVLLLKTLMQ